MRIGIVDLYKGKSGEKGFYNSQEIGIARAFVKLDYEVYIFLTSTNSKNTNEEIIDDSIKIVNVPGFAIGCHSKFDWNILLKYKIEIVHIGGDNQIFVPSLSNFCDKNNIKTYFYIGTVNSDANNKVKKAIMLRLNNRNIKVYKTHKCFAKTNSVKKQLEEHEISNVDVAPVGLDTSIIPIINETKEQLIEKLGFPQDKIILLFVGRLDAYKRPLDAINVMQDLSDNYYLVMIGNGTMKNEVDNAIVKNNLSNRIERIDKLPNKDIHKYYKVSDYFLNFNNSEIFGMSILEAMYQGSTVIAVNAPGPRDIIRDGENGFLVKNCKEMKYIIESNQRIDSNEAINSINNCFSWNNTVRIFNDWIKGINK